MKLSHLLIASLLTSSAFAAPATVVSVSGEGSKIGKDGAWRPAKAGETIGESEFLSAPTGTEVQVKLGDGTPAGFKGKVIVPGRRLATQKAAGPLLKLSESLQKAAESVVGVDVKGTAPGASKADDKLNTKAKLVFEGADTPRIASSKAEWAEKSFAENDMHLAVERAEAILKDTGESSLEKRRAHLVLGQVYVGDAEFTKALKSLTAASAPLTADETAAKKMEKGKVTFDPEAYRAAALLHRGIVYRQIGDDAKAKADFEGTIASFPAGTQAYQASFQLMVMSLEAGDRPGADKHFGAIATMKDSDNSPTATQTRELKALAQELLQRPNL
jgi:tetratricopeptide (TPR) repeat protein